MGMQKKLIETISSQRIRNIIEFLENPLLVSLLYLKFEYKPTIPFKKHEFYQEVFDALFENHDLSKGDYFKRDKKSNLTKTDFESVLEILAFETTKKGEVSYSRLDLESYLNKIIKENPEFKENSGMKLSSENFIYDLTCTVPIFCIDGLEYRWAHKSLQEFFTVKFIYKNARKSEILEKMFNGKNITRYLNIFDIYYDMDRKTFTKIFIYPISKAFIDYLNESYLNINKNISKSDLLLRKTICFGKQFVFVKSTLERNAILLANKFDFSFYKKNIIPIIEKRFTTKYANLGIVKSGSLGDYTLFIAIPQEFIKYSIIMELLQTKRSTLMLKNPLLNSKRIPLSKLKLDMDIIVVSDDKESIINTKKNFSGINNALLIPDRYGLLDHKKAKEIVENINNEIELEKSEDNLIAGL